MRRLWITGASGLLGGWLCRLAVGRWHVTGLCHTRPADLALDESITLDLADAVAVAAAFARSRPDAVIHAAASADPVYCEKNPESTEPINVTATLQLAELCAAQKIPFVFTSTDLVFDGRKPPYIEIDAVNPLGVYAGQKVRAERGVLERHPAALVCRMPLMFGQSAGVASRLFQSLFTALKQQQPLRLFADEFRTPVSARIGAAGILALLGRQGGVFHLGGREKISRYELGRAVARLGGWSDACLIPMKQAEVASSPPRPPDVSLNSGKAMACGFQPLPLMDDLSDAMKD